MKRIDTIIETIEAREALPLFSRLVYDALTQSLMSGENFFSDVEGSDLAATIGCSAAAIGGAIAHLSDAGLAYTCESDVNGKHYQFLDTYAHNAGPEFFEAIQKIAGEAEEDMFETARGDFGDDAKQELLDAIKTGETAATKKTTTTAKKATKKEDTKMTAKDDKATKLANQKHQAEAREKLAKAGKKQCTICGKNLPIDEFHKDSQKKDGHSSWCKPCTKIKATQAAGASKVTRKAAPVTKKTAKADPTKATTKTRKPLSDEAKAKKAAAAKAKRDSAREMRQAAMAAQDR